MTKQILYNLDILHTDVQESARTLYNYVISGKCIENTHSSLKNEKAAKN